LSNKTTKTKEETTELLVFISGFIKKLLRDFFILLDRNNVLHKEQTTAKKRMPERKVKDFFLRFSFKYDCSRGSGYNRLPNKNLTEN
jgi:hypothetical protein